MGRLWKGKANQSLLFRSQSVANRKLYFIFRPRRRHFLFSLHFLQAPETRVALIWNRIDPKIGFKSFLEIAKNIFVLEVYLESPQIFQKTKNLLVKNWFERMSSALTFRFQQTNFNKKIFFASIKNSKSSEFRSEHHHKSSPRIDACRVSGFAPKRPEPRCAFIAV